MGTIGTIYKATCKANGKGYVGFDSNWPKRIEDHRLVAGRKGHGYRFHAAIRKHGWDAFEWEALYQSRDLEHCISVMEPYFIRSHGTFVGVAGYNLTLGGEGGTGHRVSEEARRRIGDKHRGKAITDEQREKNRASSLAMHASLSAEKKELMRKNAGRKLSAETRAKMSAAKLGRKFSEEHRANMGAARRGRPLSEEHRQKLSAAHAGRTLSEKHREAISASQIGKPKRRTSERRRPS